VNDKSEQTFVLRDYTTLKQYWRVYVRQGAVVQVQETERRLDENVHGMLERWRLAGSETTMGYLSEACLDGAVRGPAYAKHLLVLVNDKLLGDELVAPRIKFRKNRFARDITVQSADGWCFQAHYTAPWLREMLRKFNLGGTLEYDPVDFIERLVEIVQTHRPRWLED
jgi:hypothetical protein